MYAEATDELDKVAAEMLHWPEWMLSYLSNEIEAIGTARRREELKAIGREVEVKGNVEADDEAF